MTSDRGALLRRAVAALGDEPFALIGGQALLVHGLARQTNDADLLVGTRLILDPLRWAPGDPPVVLRRADDATDPLDGIAALSPETDDDGAPLPNSPLSAEVIVLARQWVRDILARAGGRAVIAGVVVPVVDLADLAILKAYAGGPVDRADVAAIAERSDWEATRATVELRLATAGPPTAQRNWARWTRLFDASAE